VIHINTVHLRLQVSQGNIVNYLIQVLQFHVHAREGDYLVIADMSNEEAWCTDVLGENDIPWKPIPNEREFIQKVNQWSERKFRVRHLL
jgi:hypothetical protein